VAPTTATFIDASILLPEKFYLFTKPCLQKKPPGEGRLTSFYMDTYHRCKPSSEVFFMAFGMFFPVHSGAKIGGAGFFPKY